MKININMDLLNLGTKSRKTGIRPRLNILRDKYDMEDIDEFFESDNEDEIGGDKNEGRIARMINFNDDEADKFDLSPISMDKEKEKDKKRVSIQEKSGSTPSPRYDYDDIQFDDDMNDPSPIDESLDQSGISPEPTPPRNRKFTGSSRGSNNQLNSPEYSSKSPSRSASSFTKKMALGKTKRATRTKQAKPQITTSKPSPLPSPPPDGLRRSKRTKISPLAYWRGERIVYSRADEFSNDPDTTLIEDIHKIPLQEIKEVIHVTPNVDPIPKRRRTRKKNKEEHYDYESDPEVIGSEWFKNKTLELEVYENQQLESTTSREIAYTMEYDKFNEPPKSSDIENYKIAPVFEQTSNLAGGIFEFPVEGFKSSKSSGNCTYMFHVIKGLVEVNLSNNTFAVTRGCSFQVPSGNTYGITNIGTTPAKLFCVQVLTEES